MNLPTAKNSSTSRLLAAAVSTLAFIVPVEMSVDSVPAPNNPRTMVWYLSLKKPFFKPPDWLIPVAWTGIEAGLSVAAYRLMRAQPSVERQQALGLWGWNVFMIGAWSKLFFKKRELAVSTFASASMIATSLALVKKATVVDRTAARASLPLVGWVTFATLLTASVWMLNPRKR